jgi:RNA polymerase sigma factor (sigma-70 family)
VTDEEKMLREKMPLAMSLASKLVWQRNVFWIEYQDVAQEGLIGYLEASRRYQPGDASLNTYAMDRCNGAMLDAIRPPRSACRMPDSALCELESAEHVQSSDGSELINALALQKIYYAIGLLPEKMRDVMRLIYEDDLSMLEAGERIGVSEGRVSQIHKKAIKILRDRYGH